MHKPTQLASGLFIGLMSGTSLDAVDAVLMDLSERLPKLLKTQAEPIPKSLRQDVLALCRPGNNAIARMGKADVKLGQLFADSVLHLLDASNCKAEDICAIGSHGQTIRHMPDENPPFTLQIGDPNIIAAKTGITTIADFRRRDMALGGQGAPLAPAFHDHLLRSSTENCWVLNIGGMANLTFLPADTQQTIIGFDTGPGNTLMDAWHQKHKKGSYDKDGEWAASGKCDPILLEQLLMDAYFKKTPPKSTGREYFNLDWLEKQISKISHTLQPEDIQATLLILSAKSIADAIQIYSEKAKKLWICGGGVHNKLLVQQLVLQNPELSIHSTAEAGIPPDWIEAAAFAWLAQQTLLGKPGNIPTVTGAKSAAVLGAIYL